MPQPGCDSTQKEASISPSGILCILKRSGNDVPRGRSDPFEGRAGGDGGALPCTGKTGHEEKIPHGIVSRVLLCTDVL